MSENQSLVETFVARVRQRLNRHRLFTTLVWSIAMGAGSLTILALWYTLRGYAVPRAAIVITIAITLLVGLLAWAYKLFNLDAAARVSDEFYRLHDAISSYLHFSRGGRSGGY